ncbi:KR domain-containing protein [Nonomuraea sp. NPDC050556]|uniref:KR domain-containing protein n=1 Tax=Nonomuraea sp. NPDC050556 TaxID=3364369 RepID=UPI0037AD0336
MSTVLIIGMGDMGERLAGRLGEGGHVRRLVLAGRSTVDEVAAAVASTSECLVEAAKVDATSREQVAELIDRTRPDLVIQCAAVRGPWAMAGREDAAALAVARAGLALRLPYQLPVPLAVMRATRDAGYTGPVANLSFPDVTGPVLAALGLAPTLGLGNAAMIQLRVRSALSAPRPLIRVLAHHSQVFDVMQAREPAEPVRVYLGEDGRRADELAYQAPPLAPGIRYNHVTAAAAIPVLHALLPGAAPLRWSTASPGGLPGGYPVLIERGTVTLDLPPGLDRAEAIAFNEHHARGDGVERIDDDGTVHFTQECRQAVPHLTAPLAVSDLEERAEALDAFLDD